MDSVGEGDGGERPRDPAGDARPGGSAVGLMENFPAVSGRDPAESVREGDAAEFSRIGTVLTLSDGPAVRRREDPDGLRGAERVGGRQNDPHRRAASRAPAVLLVHPSNGHSGMNGGEGGIRTHGPLAETLAFEASPIGRSGTSPDDGGPGF